MSVASICKRFSELTNSLKTFKSQQGLNISNRTKVQLYDVNILHLAIGIGADYLRRGSRVQAQTQTHFLVDSLTNLKESYNITVQFKSFHSAAIRNGFPPRVRNVVSPHTLKFLVICSISNKFGFGLS